MKRPTFFQGVGVALLAALLGELLFVALTPLLGSHAALQTVIATAALGYILYLLRASGQRLGRLVTIAAWLAATLFTTWWSPHLGLYLLIQVMAIWLVRALYFHASLLTAMADLGLNLVAVGAALWASAHTASLPLSLWCFFLVQALFVMLPPQPFAASGKGAPVPDNDAFEQARRAAQAALRKLSSVH